MIMMRLAIHDFKHIVKMVRLQRDDEDVYFAYLRKTCHVLDKGLHTIPFEKGHSKRTYQEAQYLNNKISDSTIKKDPSYQWCSTVIENYENAQLYGCNDQNKGCLKFMNEQKLEFYKFLKSRISSRNFSTEIISDDTWDEIIEISSHAPNSCCKQTTRYYIISDVQMIATVVRHVAGATGFNNYIPYLICVTSDLRPYSVVDRFLPLIDSALSVENFVLAARANNVFTTILNWQHATAKDNKKVKQILNIPAYEQINLFIAAGYAENVPEKPSRLGIRFIRKM